MMTIARASVLELLTVLVLAQEAGAQESPWLHPGCRPLPTKTLGPFIRLQDGRIFAVDSGNALFTTDEGATWSSAPLFKAGQDFEVSSERALVQTRGGAIIVAFMNMKEQDWRWNSRKHDADPGTRLPTYAMRSVDKGATWEPPRKLHDEWSGAVRNMIQTTKGQVVFTAMKLLNNPGRHSVLTYVSSDEGATWRGSNIVDLGGNGHHGGATEATLVELKDGRLWKLIRTNYGRFWQAWSDDKGLSWRVIQPSNIAASSAPGQLLRLASGRLMLSWNRPYPEGKTEYPLTGGDNEWSEVPVSNHRGELSVAFSDDDGASWTAPVVVARQPGASLAYPYMFERAPGEIWLTTMQGGVRVSLKERDLIGESRR
jgi:sialidase-1